MLVREVVASWNTSENYKPVIPARYCISKNILKFHFAKLIMKNLPDIMFSIYFRYTRVSVKKQRHEDINKFHATVCEKDTEKQLPLCKYEEAYRYTWPLRTKAMVIGKAKLDRLVRVYLLLLKKSFVSTIINV